MFLFCLQVIIHICPILVKLDAHDTNIIHLLKNSDNYTYHFFNPIKSQRLPKIYVYTPRVIIRITNDYFPTKYQPLGK